MPERLQESFGVAARAHDQADWRSLVELLRYRATARPEQVAYLFLKERSAEDDNFNRISYASLDHQARTIAATWHSPALHRETMALLQYTSGSTNRPRGVMITHGNLLHNLGLIQRGFDSGPSSVGISWLPPYHDMGLIGGILQPVFACFPVA